MDIDAYKLICNALNKDIKPTYSEDGVGNIKHSNANISNAKEKLGYLPSWSFEKGINEAIDCYIRNI